MQKGSKHQNSSICIVIQVQNAACHFCGGCIPPNPREVGRQPSSWTNTLKFTCWSSSAGTLFACLTCGSEEHILVTTMYVL